LHSQGLRGEARLQEAACIEVHEKRHREALGCKAANQGGGDDQVAARPEEQAIQIQWSSSTSANPTEAANSPRFR
jgi:hypothetical protein